MHWAQVPLWVTSGRSIPAQDVSLTPPLGRCVPQRWKAVASLGLLEPPSHHGGRLQDRQGGACPSVTPPVVGSFVPSRPFRCPFPHDQDASPCIP